MEDKENVLLGDKDIYDYPLYVKEAFIPSTSLSPAKEKEVFICKGPLSKRYHYTKDCGGLRRCSTEKYKITVSKAKALGRTLCGYED